MWVIIEGVTWLWEGSLGSTAFALTLTTSGHMVAYTTNPFLLSLPKPGGHSTEVLELPIILQGHCESKCVRSGRRVQSMTRKLGSRKLQKGQA